jgi:hypothetical protein
MMLTIHSNTLESSTSPAENPSTGFRDRSARRTQRQWAHRMHDIGVARVRPHAATSVERAGRRLGSLISRHESAARSNATTYTTRVRGECVEMFIHGASVTPRARAP